MRKRIRFVCLALVCLCVLPACGHREDTQSAETSATSAAAQINADALLGEADVQHYDCTERGHVFSAATCKNAATCYYCGETQGEKGAHDFTHATCLKKSFCTVCGLERGELAAHIFSTASCAGPASCAVCGVTSGSARAHSFRPATCVSPSRCSVCMKTTGAALGHAWSGGSCTTPQVCTRCKRQIAAPGHKMSVGTCTQDAVCSVCGYTVKAPGHQFQNGKCTVCGCTREEASREESSRAALTETETETTTQPLDLDTMQQYGKTIDERLQAAHDLADESIEKTDGTGVEKLTEAVAALQSALDTLDEADALCKEDARLQSLQSALDEIRKAILSAAALDAARGNFADNAMTVRGAATAGRSAYDRFRTALDALTNPKPTQKVAYFSF